MKISHAPLRKIDVGGREIAQRSQIHMGICEAEGSQGVNKRNVYDQKALRNCFSYFGPHLVERWRKLLCEDGGKVGGFKTSLEAILHFSSSFLFSILNLCWIQPTNFCVSYETHWTLWCFLKNRCCLKSHSQKAKVLLFFADFSNNQKNDGEEFKGEKKERVELW